MIAATRSSPSPRLLRAWRDTLYEAAGIAIRIGRRSPAVDALLRDLGCRYGALLTAWNPASRRLPDGVNRRRQHRLAEWLRRMVSVPAKGTLLAWREEMVLVAADPRTLTVIARRFAQSAIVTLRTGQRARVTLI